MKDAEKWYVGHERFVEVRGVMIKVNLDYDDYHNARNQVEIEPDEAIDWLNRVIVGKIIKADLDIERTKETSGNDLMENANIVYHTESIIEMQVACLLSMLAITYRWMDSRNYKLVGAGL